MLKKENTFLMPASFMSTQLVLLKWLEFTIQLREIYVQYLIWQQHNLTVLITNYCES